MTASAKNRSIRLPCILFDGVKCSHRKSMGQQILRECMDCPHWERFEREMDEEDQRMDAKVEEIFRTGVWK